jgi:putative tricarboxylic transport membrane protein
MGQELLELLHPAVLFYWFVGMAFGVFIGATPGLTATMGVALVVPISFYLPPNAGLAMILGVSFTAIFSGDIPATYIRIPGTPASAAATLDSFAMAQQGRASFALMLDLWCSAIGGLIGVVLLIFVSPQLARLAIQFSNFEYFWLGVLGLSLSAVVCVGSTFRGILAAMFGMLLATVGLDMVSGTARFTFGNSDLSGGLSFIPAMIGLFGLSEVLRNLHSRATMSASMVVSADRTSAGEVASTIWRNKGTVVRSSLLGTFIGALPGAGADIAAWVSYGVAQRLSRRPEQFGQGCAEGVIAPTSANNAAVGGAWIPALVLGIPGDSVTAIVLGALLMYNIKPGPLVFEQNASQMRSLFLIVAITQFLLIPAGYAGIRAFAWILRMPRNIVMTGVVVFSVLGAYSLRNSLFDVWLMCGFGLLGFALEAWRVPLAPLILGMILGPMVEENLRVGLIKTGGDWTPFFTRPICATIVGLFAATLLVPAILRLARRWSPRPSPQPPF